MNTRHHPFITALLCSIFSGCFAAVDVDDPEQNSEIGVSAQAVTGGTRAPLAALPDNGVVRISGGGICSGTLLTNRWVLTADHCFCPSNVNNPGGTLVSVYGTLDATADPTMSSIYTTTATQIIRNPTYDVALIKLKNTLPFTWAPMFYTGNGSDLVNLTAHVMGFGDNHFSGSTPVGAGESEFFGDMRVNSVSTTSGVTQLSICSPQTDNYWTKSNPGPRLGPLPGGNVNTQGGDSGSAAFLDTLEARRIIGTLTGGGGSTSVYTGIWYVRDWIKQQTGIWTANECGNTSLPSSLNTDKPAIALGPDGKLHAVAVFTDKSIGHWSSSNGKSWSYLGKVPNASTDTKPALTAETAAASGQPLKLGLAFRNPTNNVFTYSRWSASGGWSQPAPQFLQVKGGMGAHRGLIAFVGLDNRAGVTAYQPSNNTFVPVQWAPAGAPAVDAARGISAVYDPVSGKSTIGYLTTSNQWVQMRGDWSCFIFSYLCNPDPAYNTDWNQASLANVDGDRAYLETVRILSNGWPRHERRVRNGAASFDWGWGHYLLGTESVTDFNGEVFAIRSTYAGSLLVSPVNNCFANQF